jgi:hypothetical protein
MFNTNKVVVKTSLMGLLALSLIGLTCPAFAQEVDHEQLKDRPRSELSDAERAKLDENDRVTSGRAAHTATDNMADSLKKPIVLKSKAAVVDTRFTDKKLFPVDDPKIGADLRGYLEIVKGNAGRSAKLSELEIQVTTHKEITGKLAQGFMTAGAHFMAELSPDQVEKLDVKKLVAAFAVYATSEAGPNDVHILDHAADYARDHQGARIQDVVKGGIEAFTGDKTMDAKQEEELANCALGA